MIEMVLASADISAIRAELLSGETEKCVILFANQTKRLDGTLRLLIREIQFPLPADYRRIGLLEAELNPEFVARVTKHARRLGYALVFAHSHPGSEAPQFSPVDGDGEEHLKQFMARRHPKMAHAVLLLSAGGVRARILGSGGDIRVISLGEKRDILFDPDSSQISISQAFDRQVRAFGITGQSQLARLQVAIVGLGGTGSLIAQQLVHFGVRDFVLVDPDILDVTNLNRVANATPKDAGQPKVRIAARYIRAISQDSNVRCVQGDVTQSDVAKELQNSDMIFGCTDSHGSRAVIQQTSYQYMIPCIDMGVTIAVVDGRLTHIYGRVQLLSPGLACLTCGNLLDANEVRQDMMSAFERQADPYIRGEREPAPAVMSLNGTVASLAGTMLLAVITGIPVGPRHVLYNAMTSTLRAVRADPQSNCYICSRAGAFARGDSWPLFARGE